jgi:hypothetical protein
VQRVIPNVQLLSPADCARLVGGALTPAAFREAARRGRLQAIVTRGGMHLFEQAEVERYLSERAQRQAGGVKLEVKS